MSASDSEMTRALGRVRKMLRLAENDGATEGERDNALRMAYATMAKYNIDLVTAKGPAPEDDPRAEHQEVFLGKAWARSINSDIADLFFCRYFYYKTSSSGPNEKHRHAFVGKRSNALAAIDLARYIVESTNREAGRAARAAGQGFPYHRSFCLGVAGRIRQRCAELRIKALEAEKHEATPGQALVLASVYQREAEANALVMASHVFSKPRGPAFKKGVLAEAADRGRAYGNSVNLTPSKTKRLT
jgi:hypothetical protein